MRGRWSCRSPALFGLRQARRAAGGPVTPAYALRLDQVGVPVEFHLHPGAPHEFDFIAFTTTGARRRRRPRSFEHRMPLSLTGGCRAASRSTPTTT